MDHSEAALKTCELLARWSGDTVKSYQEFSREMDAAYQLNQQIAVGGLVVLSAAEHQELLDNQKKRR